MIKKVAIYDPYLDTLGGGERYCLSVAELFLKKGCQVDLFWSGDPIFIKKAEDRFSLNLEGINIIPDVFNQQPTQIDKIHSNESFNRISNKNSDEYDFTKKISDFKCKILTTMQYDLLFFLGDGSIPCLFAKKNILHIQVPFRQENTKFESLKNIAKYPTIHKIVCNSNFTSNHIPKIFNKKSITIYPPVDVNKFYSSDNKENIILSVGRFDNILNAKKQDILIETFKKIFDSGKANGWKLVLAGGSLQQTENNSYLNFLKDLSKDYPIDIHVNPDFKSLQELYSKSKIYWHATGYGVDQDLHPEHTEHFGITVVESMASGLVPVCINKGGIPEIIDNGITGYLWDTFDQLIEKTVLLISSPELLKNISDQAQKTTARFSKETFQKQFIDLIYK